MNIPSKLAHKFARSTLVSGASSLGAIVSLLVVLNDVMQQSTPSLSAIFVTVFAVIVFVIVNLYSLKIRAENKNLEDIADQFRQINALYRESLFGLFANNQEPPDLKDRLLCEQKTLKGICQQISRIFSKLNDGKEFTVSIKLLTEDGGKTFATTYVRNFESCERDLEAGQKYEVDTGKNSGLDRALQARPAGSLSYFHSADLNKEEDYTNQRMNYLNYYKSTIVVPIRCPRISTRNRDHTYGMLAVDTMSRHRLNNKHHVVMMSALAEQMFNFMAFIRGDYNSAKRDCT